MSSRKRPEVRRERRRGIRRRANDFLRDVLSREKRARGETDTSVIREVLASGAGIAAQPLPSGNGANGRAPRVYITDDDAERGWDGRSRAT